VPDAPTPRPEPDRRDASEEGTGTGEREVSDDSSSDDSGRTVPPLWIVLALAAVTLGLWWRAVVACRQW
jgi:hypothetical protein